MLGLELLSFSVRNLSHQKIRTGLTLLGIIIGIATIVAMLSIGEGLKIYTAESFERMGKNKLFVMPGGGTAGMAFGASAFSQEDVDTISRVRGVEIATGVYTGAILMEYNDKKVVSYLLGLDPAKAEELLGGPTGYKIIKGRWPTERDSGGVVLGYLLATKTFDKEINPRDSILIGGRSFRVIGVMEELGNSQDDSQAYMSIEDAWDVSGVKDQLYMIFVNVKSGEDPEEVAKRVERALEKRKDPETFTVTTPGKLLEQFGMFITVLNVVLGGIAGISLVVGGIGIMNTMLMSVLERTKEIGIMKALGATNRQVMQFFITEAGLLGLTGGVIGILIGISVSKLVQYAASSAGVPLKNAVTPDIIFGGMAFAITVGILSGLYPAYRAAKLDPVEALRYE